MCRVLFLLFFPHCFHFSPSPVCSVSRVSCAALVAARHALRRHRAVRRCGPLSTRIHQAFRHHVMCVFDTSLSLCVWFTSYSSSLRSPRALLFPSSSSSCSPWAFTSSFRLSSASCALLSFPRSSLSPSSSCASRTLLSASRSSLTFSSSCASLRSLFPIPVFS